MVQVSEIRKNKKKLLAVGEVVIPVDINNRQIGRVDVLSDGFVFTDLRGVTMATLTLNERSASRVIGTSKFLAELL